MGRSPAGVSSPLKRWRSGSSQSPTATSRSTSVAAAWPTYLCIWVRKIDPQSSSLYWAIASLVIGVGFLFSWLLWIVVIYELREEFLEHYNRREPINLRLNWFLTLLFSFVYFQFVLNRITRLKEAAREPFAAESQGSVIA